MIAVPFAPPAGDPGWEDWIARAAAATDQLQGKADGERTIDDALYKAQRARFFQATYGKCAYCEGRLAAQNGYGDVEHYRPKGRARGLDGKIAKIRRNGVEVDHPGYFWLAYDYRNLCPSCPRCNRRSAGVEGDPMSGKSDLFPTMDGTWAGTPDDLAGEHPALLKPWMCDDDPAEHLVFDPDTGHVFHCTERGRITIEVLGLERDALVQERYEAAQMVKDVVVVAAGKVVDDGVTERAALVLNAIAVGAVQYAAICRAAVARAVPGFRALLTQLEAAAKATAYTPEE